MRNYSFLMTKPWEPLSEEIEWRVISTLERGLSGSGDFKRTRNPYRMVAPSREFWEEFYSHVPKKNS